MTTESPRPLSVNLEAEQAILGAILVNNEAYHVVSGFLLPKHFSEEVHRIVFRALGTTIGMGQLATPKTLVNKLRDANATVGQLTLGQYVARLAAEAVTVVNAPDYARAVLEAWAERELVRTGILMQERTGEGPERPGVLEQIEAAEADLAKLRRALGGSAGGTGGVQVSEAVTELIERAEAAKRGETIVTSTGMKDFDHRIMGYMPTRLGIIAGRPGMGKTVLMTESARRVAMRSSLQTNPSERIAVGFLSCEIAMDELTARLVAGGSFDTWKVAYKDIVSGSFDADLVDRTIVHLRHARDRLKAYPLYVEFTPGISAIEVAGRVRMMKARAQREGFTLGLVFLDYLGLMRASERYRGQKVNELGEIVLDLKHIAQDESVQMVVGSQLSRQVENRDDKRPQLSDLRDSGNIEEHADWVGMVYRPAYYIEQSPKWNGGGADAETMAKWEQVKNDMDIYVPKARVGIPGRAQLYSDVACSFVGDKSRYG